MCYVVEGENDLNFWGKTTWQISIQNGFLKRKQPAHLLAPKAHTGHAASQWHFLAWVGYAIAMAIPHHGDVIVLSQQRDHDTSDIHEQKA